MAGSEIGCYLDKTHEDANFITPEVARLARREVAYREDDALIDEDRSSATCFRRTRQRSTRLARLSWT
jgi:hypothetical protein